MIRVLLQRSSTILEGIADLKQILSRLQSPAMSRMTSPSTNPESPCTPLRLAARVDTLSVDAKIAICQSVAAARSEMRVSSTDTCDSMDLDSYSLNRNV